MNTTEAMRLDSPQSVIAAIPYLVGFQPIASVVLIVLTGSRVMCTVRMDVEDATAYLLADTLGKLSSQGGTRLLAVTYSGSADHDAIQAAAAAQDMELVDHMRVDAGRWWSLLCDNTDCCPAEGNPIDQDTTVAAEMVYRGLAPETSREAMVAAVDPNPDAADLLPLLDTFQEAQHDAVTQDRFRSWLYTEKRAVFAAARRASTEAITAEDAARSAIALGSIAVRDALWLAIEAKKVDALNFTAQLCRMVPGDHRAPALFLHGWQLWRAGNGAMARECAIATLTIDPEYSAAQLLNTIGMAAMDPNRMPALRTAR